MAAAKTVFFSSPALLQQSFNSSQTRPHPSIISLKSNPSNGVFIRGRNFRTTPVTRERRNTVLTVSRLVDGNSGDDDESEQRNSDTGAAIDIKLPRRSLMVTFTCNQCGERTKRLINRLAYERGLVFVQLHIKKRNRPAQNHLSDIVFIKYNRALRRQYNIQDITDPISLEEINKSNELLVGRINVESKEEDGSLPWIDVAKAVEVEKRIYRSRESISKTTKSSSCSSTPIDVEVDSNETVEEDVDNYESDDYETVEEDVDNYEFNGKETEVKEVDNYLSSGSETEEEDPDNYKSDDGRDEIESLFSDDEF